jgi:hypothetical protein
MNITTTNATADANATAAFEKKGEQQQNNYNASITAEILIPKIWGWQLVVFCLPNSFFFCLTLFLSLSVQYNSRALVIVYMLPSWLKAITIRIIATMMM